ncbi:MULTISPECIES: SMI1/KNR4 family protein [unclassified Streptomyces]|uniref:SMI1/KNR4 family protein n=1 Tax=unclassified Streptomyces TaxID=2593676 RepID=UPI0037FC119E
MSDESGAGASGTSPDRVDPADPAELAALRAVFGSDGGCRPPLGWAAVRAFEAEHGVVLPEPYRTFVAEIADGSASGPPEYGFLPLAELPSDWDGEADVRSLSSPFPLTEAWMWEDEDDDGPESVADGEDVDAVLDRVHGDGSVVLGTDGCAMNWHLVVTGPHRGQIWMITDVGAVPFGAPYGHTTAEPGFTGWVRHWADKKSWYDVA